MIFKFPTNKTPVLFQGITSSSGAMHAEKAFTYGTNIVAGISRNKNITDFQGVPIFQTVKEAVKKTKPQISVIFSSPNRAYAEVEEAAKAKIPLIICTTNHIPYHDVIKMKQITQECGVMLIGPSAPGLVNVDECLVGTIPAHLFPKGNIGIISRSSSLTYEAVQQLSKFGLGVSACASIGSAAILCSSYTPFIQSFLNDKNTHSILIIGKLNGYFEHELAHFLKTKKLMKKIAIYLPGKTRVSCSKAQVIGSQNNGSKSFVEKEKILKETGVYLIRSAETIGQEMADFLAHS